MDHSWKVGQKLLHAVADEVFEDLSHVFRSDIEELPNFLLGEVVGNDFFVALADVVEVDLIDVLFAVFADFPEYDGSDGVVANIKLSACYDAFAHVDHRFLLCWSNFSFPADAHDDVLGLRDGYELDLVFQEVIELAYYFSPSCQSQVGELADVELLEVVFLLKTGRKDRVARDVLD